jgi:uncharacterized protein (DUF849 family)
MLHLHVRDRDGRHSLEPGIYRDAIDAVRRAVGSRLLLQVTSEAARTFTPAEQTAAIRAVRPEAVSVALRELAPAGEASLESEAATFFAWLRRERVAAQYILYDRSDVDRYRDLKRRGIIPGDGHSVLYVLGRYSGGMQSQPHDLLPFLDSREDDDPAWMVCAFGAREHACTTAAAAFGGHVRVGFENNLALADGRIAPDNAALVAQAAAAAGTLARPLADADSARAILGPGL